jgi:putative ABC transport system substrate-binding protein
MEGRPERVSETAVDFVRQNVSVIVTYGSAVAAFKKATTVIPIVFAVAVDPVGAGLVANLAQPGGNVTGLSLQQIDAVGKRLELLHQAMPQLRKLAIMADAGYPDAVQEAHNVEVTARARGLEAALLEIRRAEDIASAFESPKAKADALNVVSDALIAANRSRIITFALSAHMPTMLSYRDYVQAGGLMSYGPNYVDMFRHAAEIVDKILRGIKPGDIPVEQPTKFEFVINLTTAKALGLTIPASLLSLADELLE